MLRAFFFLFAFVFGMSAAIAKELKAVPVEARDPKTPVSVAIHLVQKELAIGVNPDLATANSGGNPYGLVGALTVAFLESSANKKARAELEPFMSALGDFDASIPLMSGIRAGISNLAWIKLLTDSPMSTNSEASKKSLLDGISGNFLADVDCIYTIGRSFEAIYARCFVQIADKRVLATTPSYRWDSSKLLINRAVQSEISQPPKTEISRYNRCYLQKNKSWCHSQWMDNSAKQLKQELASALEQVGTLAAKQITLGAEELDLSSKPKDTLVRLSPSQSGYALTGINNVEYRGEPSGMWSNFKPAIIASGTEGVLVIKDDGSLLHSRVLKEP